jgi:ferrous iron transport protein A
MPLTIVQPGRSVRIVSVNAGQGLQGRLSAMGLVPGAEVTVLQNCLRGPFLLGLGGGRIALGRGVANRIVVE